MPAKPRASRRRIAEMSLLLRALLDDIAAAGGMKGKVHREALDLVDAFARSGEAPPPAALAAARAAIAKVVGRIGVGSSPPLMALSFVPVELVLRMVEEGDDLGRYVVEHAERAVVGHPPEGAGKRVEALLAQARALAAGIDDAPRPAPTDLAALPVHDLDLPAIALAHLTARGARRGGKHADATATAALLTEHGRPVSPAILSFEAAYGGLELFETDPEAPALVAGPYAFFSATPRYTGRHRELAPVIVAWNDVIYALDAGGRGFTQAAMVEGVFRPSAPDGRTLLTQAILWRALETHPGSLVTREGSLGAAMAKERGLSAISGANGETERWWGDAGGAQAMRLVVEIDRGNGHEKAMTVATGDVSPRPSR